MLQSAESSLATSDSASVPEPWLANLPVGRMVWQEAVPEPV